VNDNNNNNNSNWSNNFFSPNKRKCLFCLLLTLLTRFHTHFIIHPTSSNSLNSLSHTLYYPPHTQKKHPLFYYTHFMIILSHTHFSPTNSLAFSFINTFSLSLSHTHKDIQFTLTFLVMVMMSILFFVDVLTNYNDDKETKSRSLNSTLDNKLSLPSFYSNNQFIWEK